MGVEKDHEKAKFTVQQPGMWASARLLQEGDN